MIDRLVVTGVAIGAAVPAHAAQQVLPRKEMALIEPGVHHAGEAALDVGGDRLGRRLVEDQLEVVPFMRCAAETRKAQ